jgi:hypothetical protein
MVPIWSGRLRCSSHSADQKIDHSRRRLRKSSARAEADANAGPIPALNGSRRHTGSDKRGVDMSKSPIGNTKECRKHALACLRLAQTSASPHAREQFANLAKTWLKLAGDLQALRDTLEEPESRGRTG